MGQNVIGSLLQDSCSPSPGFLIIPTKRIIVHYYIMQSGCSSSFVLLINLVIFTTAIDQNVFILLKVISMLKFYGMQI